MRRKNREIDIFSMSALDLFASALGAFILITIILMPYYGKTNPSSKTPSTVCKAPKTTVCPSCELPKPPICQPKKKVPVTNVIVDKFLVLTVEWDQKIDIDTYVQTPDGWYGPGAGPGHFKIPGTQGAFVVDNNWGGRGSVELWRIIAPSAGDYTFCANYYGAVKNGAGGFYPVPPLNQVRARAILDKPTGPITFNNLRFSQMLRVDNNPFPRLKGQMNCFLKLRVDAKYKVTVLRQ